MMIFYWILVLDDRVRQKRSSLNFNVVDSPLGIEEFNLTV